jgi:hypothetical protein
VRKALRQKKKSKSKTREDLEYSDGEKNIETKSGGWGEE